MSEWTCPKMLPGETPYAHEEWKKLQKLLRGATACEENMTSEELDEVERELEEKEENPR